MTIRLKILLGYLATVAVLSAAGAVGLRQLELGLEAEIGQQTLGLAASLLDQAEARVFHRAEQVLELVVTTGTLHRALDASNRAFLTLGDAADRASTIAERDAAWQAWAVDQAELPPIVQEVESAPLSTRLREQIAFYEREAGYPVFGEVFVTNRYGVNIAQTSITSDYRQDDEGWWQAGTRQPLWLSAVGFDDSSGVYSIDFSARVLDRGGALLGVLKAVLNIEEIHRILRAFEDASPIASVRVQLRDQRGAVLYPRFEAPPAAGAPAAQATESAGGIEVASGRLRAVVRSQGDPDLGWVLALSYDTADVLAPVETLRGRFLIIGLVALVISVVLGVLVAASISGPIEQSAAAAARLADGELAVAIEPQGKGEGRQLLEAMRRMLDRLRHTIGGVVSTAREIGTSADVLGTSSRRLATGAEDQSAATAVSGDLVHEMADSIEQVAKSAEQMVRGVHAVARSVDETVASIESIAHNAGQVADEVRSSLDTAGEIVGSVDRVAQRAQEVGRASSGAVEEARRGGAAVAENSQGMEELSATIDELVAVHRRLDESSRRIHRTTDVIEGIAAQTHLLAVNAAVQASHASSRGEGFAVVAQEMQGLSESTARSAAEIGQVIEEVRRDIEGAAAITATGHRQARAGLERAAHTAAALDRIVETSQTARQAMQSIERDTATQTRVAEAMAIAFGRIGERAEAVKDETDRHQATSEAIRQAMAGLASASDRVRSAIEQHRRDGGEVDQAIERIAETSRGNVETANLLVEVTRTLEAQSEALSRLASFFSQPADTAADVAPGEES